MFLLSLAQQLETPEGAAAADVSARRAISGEIMDSYPSLSFFFFFFFPFLLFSSHSFHFASRRGGGGGAAAAAENCCISKRKTRKWNDGGGGGGSGVNLHEKVVVDDVVESRV